MVFHHGDFLIWKPNMLLFSIQGDFLPTSGVGLSRETDLAKERFLMKILSFAGFCAKWCGPVSLLIVLGFSGQRIAQSAPLSPGDVVQLWLTVYQDNLDRAANMTRLNVSRGKIGLMPRTLFFEGCAYSMDKVGSCTKTFKEMRYGSFFGCGCRPGWDLPSKMNSIPL